MIFRCHILYRKFTYLGELPRAYIVPRDPSLTQEEVHNHLKDKLAEHKQLGGGIQFVQAIPKSASGKILRKDLREDYRKMKIGERI